MQHTRQKRTKYLLTASTVAALYVILTMLSAALGISNGVIQLRLSEALIATVAFTPAAIPGMFIGCLIANLLTGAVFWDVIFGSLATLIGAFGGWFLRKHKYLIPIPSIIANSVIIPFVLMYAYGAEGALPVFFLTVLLGEIVSAGILGALLYGVLNKYRKYIPF